jgi:predicted HTH transcriptional regulator
MGKGLFGRLQAEVTVREKHPGLDMGNILDLPDDEREIITWMLREKSVNQIKLAAHLGKDEAQARTTLDALVEKGYIREIDIKGQVEYRVRLKPKRKVNMPSNLWAAIEGKTEE